MPSPFTLNSAVLPRRTTFLPLGLLLLGWLPVVVPARDAAEAPAPGWVAGLDAGVPGPLPAPRAFQAVYRMRWGNVEGARAEVDFRPGPGPGEAQTRVDAHTQGWARNLFEMDALTLSVVRLDGLRSVRVDQTESRSKRRDVYHLAFEDGPPPAAVRSHRKAEPPGAPERSDGSEKRFVYPGLRDMNTAFLVLRSLPLENGERHTFVVMTAKSPYLARVRVIGRETVTTPATGRQPAIALELGLEKIDTATGALRPHKFFKGARVWLGDDADRMLLRAESQIFIGRVSMELERVTH